MKDVKTAMGVTRVLDVDDLGSGFNEYYMAITDELCAIVTEEEGEALNEFANYAANIGAVLRNSAPEEQELDLDASKRQIVLMFSALVAKLSPHSLREIRQRETLITYAMDMIRKIRQKQRSLGGQEDA